MSYISDKLRQEVRLRAGGKCEYCLIHEEDSLYTHEVDHIIPEKHRGETNSDNLCLACFSCNRYKGSDFASFDPQTDQIALLFNPRTDKWTEHFLIRDIQIVPLTPVGRVTEFVLNLNSETRLRERKKLSEVGRYPIQSDD